MSGEREFLMPVPGSEAALQFFTEAMRANTAVMERVDVSVTDLRKEVRDVREGMIRLEAGDLPGRVVRLEKDMEGLKADRERRDGATTALGTLWRNLPSIAAFVVGIAVIAFLFAKATGRVQ